MCRENLFGSSMFTYLQLCYLHAYMLQYGGQMGYKYESLPIRKDRYTLLLESPFLVMLDTNCCLYGRIVSLMHTLTIVSLNKSDSRTFQKRERQQNWILTSSHIQKVQPACTLSIKLHVCVGVACNAFCQYS